MPQFFFDIIDGETRYADDTGMDCTNVETARKEAEKALPDLMKEAMAESKASVVTVEIRGSANGGGAPLAKLTIRVQH